MKKLLAVGLNPALQKTLVFEDFQLGAVNRAQSLYAVPGGKGYHFARAANSIEAGSCTVLHFLGGAVGEFLELFHQELQIPQIVVQTGKETRTCTTLLGRHDTTMTELIEPSASISEEALAEMREQLLRELPTADAVGLCGTFPPGVPPDFYAWVARNKGDALLLLDAYRGVKEVLDTGNVDILKINLDEFSSLTSMNDIAEGARLVMGNYGVRLIALTDGPGRAHLLDGERHFVYDLPRLERFRNPIGAGDTVAGVMVSRLLSGMDASEAFAEGLAAGSASCLHMEGAKFTDDEVAMIRKQIQMKVV